MHEFELQGLDGSNLLGFLASLGVLRILTNVSADADVWMKWVRSGGWVPVILHSRIGEREELIEMLAQRVCGERSINAAWEIGNDLTLDSREFAALLRRYAMEAQPDRRETADYLAAFGSEAIGSGPKKEQMGDTEFRTMSGAGHQHFLGFMKDLAIETEPEHLRRALFDTWDYADPRPSLRWDPADYRPHALRAEDPSGDPIKTMRGATASPSRRYRYSRQCQLEGNLELLRFKIGTAKRRSLGQFGVNCFVWKLSPRCSPLRRFRQEKFRGV